MAKEGDMSLFNDVLEPFRRVINTDPPKEKLSASLKLNFSDSNQSLKEGLSNLLSLGKRKSSIGMGDVSTPDKRMRTESTSNAGSVPPSPWEAKKMKIDLIAAKAQITRLEARVNHQHTIRKEMQILFEEEKGSLIEQHKRDERALADMEERLQVIRRREQELKDEFSDAVKEHKEMKANWDKDKSELLKQIAELKDKLLEANVSSKDQLSEMKKDMDELLQALEGAQSEVDILKKEVAKQTSRAEQCTSLRTQLEKQTFELQQVTNKLKELEYEKDSYKDWQQQSKTAQKRLSNMAELEKEVTRLRANERSLRDAVCNKLLLEEQVHVLTTKVEALQPVQQKLHDAKVKIASLETALEEWKTAARNHGVENARALSSALEAALTSQLTATAGCSEAQSKLAQLTEEVATAKYERDKTATKLNDLQTVRKNQESLIHRLQKRLLLVTRERDSYRQQLDCYEKELTVTLSGEGGVGGAALAAARVEQLEKSLQAYRDLLASLDQTAHTKQVESLRAEVSKWREEAESLRRDVLKLQAQRDVLQAHLERLHAQPATKVLHMMDNPAAAAQKQIQTDLEAAQEEIKRLTAALREGGNVACPEEMQQLKQQLENSRIKLKRMKEEYTSCAQEYKDVVYMLLGYKIDRTGHNNYRISNMYAESAEEYLTFTLCEDGIEMVQTDYAETLSELVELHLQHHHSIPVFLSALTMNLFTRTTMQQDAHE
ncbi:mitotic spindle assembly checkpoint protein MAD1 [Galleria mellonella]|uniref:Mitotic spindle assembly checkpoint protein MAD1 n=1 Tax=Galleria mellonella TaxID=7137 RepID=A0A6J1X829_GALME|nr:mitotic spindle assembly checkpoint protein MAD1 [Galleria mellonella]XP_052755978.1 mitotic spindle assembly checkpoint protein MAD1 [Galleria mellonella]